MAKRVNPVKKIISFLHLWLGLISGIVVVMVAVTGCLYVFEEECRDIFQHKYYYVKAADETVRKDIAELQALVSKTYPAETVTGIRFKEEKGAAFIFSTKSRKAISVNPYTASVIGMRNMENDFFSIVLKLHRTLYLGDVGKQVIKWNVLIFFIMCISGLVLWWPKQKRFFRQAVRINFKTKNRKRFNWDLHSVLGFYALLVLILISLTGIFWMFDSVKDGVRLVTNSPAKKKEEKLKSDPAQSNGFNAAAAYRYTIAQNPGAKETFIGLPADSTAALRVVMRYPYTVVRKQVSMFFDQYSGKPLKEENFKNATGYEKVARANYSLHTGDIPPLGIGSKIIYFLASLVAASLPVTGFLIWLGRKRKKPVRRQMMVKAAVQVAEPQLA